MIAEGELGSPTVPLSSHEHTVILQMRLYALYFLNKKVLVLMVATFVVSSASSAVIMGTVLQGIQGLHPWPELEKHKS
jgi:hypothetical protein